METRKPSYEELATRHGWDCTPWNDGLSRADLREIALLQFASGQYDGCFTADDLLAIMEVLEG